MLVFRTENLAASLTSAHYIRRRSKAHFINLDMAIKQMGLRLHQDTVTGGNPRN